MFSNKRTYLLKILPVAIVVLSILFVYKLRVVMNAPKIVPVAKDDIIIKSCVTIQSLSGDGSGFFCQIGDNIFIVTCKHVVENQPVLVIRDIDGHPLTVKEVLIAKDGRDVAYIKFQKPGFQVSPLQYHKDVSSIPIHKRTVSYGDSLGEKVIVSAEGELLGTGSVDIEINNPIVHGNSGGPVLLKGTDKVIGIASRRGEPRKDDESLLSNKGTRFENEIRRFAVRFDNLNLNDMQKTEWGLINANDTKALNDLAIKALRNGDALTFFNILNYNRNLKDPWAIDFYCEVCFNDLYKSEGKNWSEEEKQIAFNTFCDYSYNHNSYAALLNLGYCYILGIGIKTDPEKGFQLIQEAAKAGCENAVFMEGICYGDGIGTEKDEKKAFLCFKKTASKNDPKPLNQLGWCYLNGLGTGTNQTLAFDCFIKSAIKNDPDGQYLAGMCFEHGIGTTTNMEKAVSYYSKAASQNHAQACYCLAYYYASQNDFDKAAPLFAKAAEENHTGALESLAWFYKQGLGGYPRDQKMEVDTLKKAAELGNISCMVALGNYYKNGYESYITNNSNEAAFWYKKAADLGNPEAKFSLSDLILCGNLGEKDLINAFRLIKEAAETDFVPAFYVLGNFYQNGIGTAADNGQAAHWFEMSAKNGDPKGQYFYALCFYGGKGVEKDYHKAFYWFEESAKNDYVDAMKWLGYLYEIGIGLPKSDSTKAAEWYNKAYIKGDAFSAIRLGLMYKNGQGVRKDSAFSRKLFNFAKEKLGEEEFNAVLKQENEKNNESKQFIITTEGLIKNWEKVNEKDIESICQSPPMIFNPKETNSLDEHRNLIYSKVLLNDKIAINEWFGLTYLNYLLDKEHATNYFEVFKYGADVLNYPEAITELGYCYLMGIGTTANPQKGFEYIQKAAAMGYSNAQIKEGNCFYSGLGTHQDYKKAVESYKKAAVQNNAYALNNLGNCFRDGLGTETNMELAKESYQKAADLNYCLGLYNLGWCYENGIAVPKDKKKALDYYIKAATLGELKACSRLVDYYAIEQNDYTNAAKYVRIGIDFNDPKSIYQLSLFYRNGWGGYQKNSNMEIMLLEQAAVLGNTDAMTTMGNYYRFGYEAISKDPLAAKTWFEKAIQRNDYSAAFLLGEMYYFGELGDINYNESFKYFKKAAEANIQLAYYGLGFSYLKGIGTEKNYSKAFHWLEKSANANDPSGQSYCALCFYKGLGVGKDYFKAFNLFEKAANGGDVNAMMWLGFIYQFGIENVLKPDLAKADEWYKKANQLDKKTVDIWYFDLSKEWHEKVYNDYSVDEKTKVQYFETFKYGAEVLKSPEAISKLGDMYIGGDGTVADPQKAFQITQKLAATGDIAAQWAEATCYNFGVGTDQDPKKAFEQFLKLADQNDLNSLVSLGCCYANGLGTERDDKKAFECYQKAVNLDFKPALTLLGDCYFNGVGVNQDYKKAFEYYQEAAENGLSDGRWREGLSYRDGKGTKQDYKKAFECFKDAAKQNQLFALVELGNCYQNGLGTEVNGDLAKECYQKAAEKNNNPGLCKMGELYEFGLLGVEKNIEKAISYYSKAIVNNFHYMEPIYRLANLYAREENYEKALEYINKGVEQNDPYSIYILSTYYGNGAGVPKDPAKEIELLRKAAELGDIYAMTDLGGYYNFGYDGFIEKNPLEAANWYSKAAELGYTPAKTSLGTMYFNGQLGDTNRFEAFRYIKEAAEDGNAEAFWMLGCCYFNGFGIEKDLNKAAYWLEKSANAGNDTAKCLYGNILIEGWGVEKDIKKGFALIKEAAENNDKPAWFLLGSCYLRGLGTEKDENKGVHFIEKSANAGFPDGQSAYGFCLLKGLVVTQDYQKGFAWCKKAADVGNAFGKSICGLCFLKGWGVTQDYQKAFTWCKSGADANDASGMAFLGYLYENGYGVAKPDKNKALELYQKAYQGGSADAAFWLGKMYLEGTVVNKDLSKAKECFNFAWEIGQIEEARNLLQECQ